MYKRQVKDTVLEKVNTFEVKAPLEFVQLYDLDKTSTSYVFAYGGEENLIKLVELDSEFQNLKQIWEAKNVKNDRLDMRVPVWPTSVKFLKPFPEKSQEKDSLNYQFITVTHWSHLGKYKTVHGRKPLEYIDLLPNREPLTDLQISSTTAEVTANGNLESDDLNDFTFITRDTKKDVIKFNSTGRLIKKYGKGDIVGATSFTAVYQKKYLLQGGLDRYLRVFDLETSQLLVKVYIGGKVNFVTMMDENDIALPGRDANGVKLSEKDKKKRARREEMEEDAEQLWNRLESSNKKLKK